jgi:hypothetical protein
MPRAYTVATAALALHVSNKWLDNTLSHYSVQGVSQERQGISRTLSLEALGILDIGLALMADLELPLGRALGVAAELHRSAGKAILPAGTGIEINLEHLTAALLSRLEHAVEVAPLPRRGRPPQKTTGRPD